MHFHSFNFLLAVAALPMCLGRAVVRNNTERVLHTRQLATVYTNCNTPNTAALTFDDGPYIYHTQVSNILSDAGILGTFFLNGNNYDCIYDQAQVSAIRTSFAAGHQIASHTWSHPDLTTLSQSQIRDQLERINTALRKILGVVPAIMRPPYGSYNDDVRTVAESIGQSVVLWSFDSGDSTGSTPQASEQGYRTLANQHPDHIISLQHETVQTTVNQVLPAAIQTLKNAGYNFATVSDCLGIPAYLSTQAPGTRDSSWVC